MRSGKLVIAEGGGPTAVINQSLVGAVLEARLFPQIERIYGARYGVRGIVDEDFVDLSIESRTNLEAISVTPSSALGSTRDKPDLAYCRDIFASLKAHGAAWFLYIGGNDTAQTVRIVSEEAAKKGYDLRCLHVPKTIDNDLMENDHSPGFPSAARFVVEAFMGGDLDDRALLGVYLAVVMGRDFGFLTGASAAARTVEGDGPHLIYLPERAFDENQIFLAGQERPRQTRALRHRGVRGHPRRARYTAVDQDGQERGERSARQHPALQRGHARGLLVRGDQIQAAHHTRARRCVRLPSTLLRGMRFGR